MALDLQSIQAQLGQQLIPREDFEAFLDEYIRTQHPQINHPWVTMLFRGELTHDDLRVHALQFEHFLRFAPSHFLMIGANAEPHTIPGPDDMRRDAVQNLMEDMGLDDPSGDHFAIWRRFPYALGLTKEDLDDSRPAPSTLAFNYAYLYFLKNLSHPEALAFQQFANESVFALGLVDKRREALTKHYGLVLEDTWSPPTEEETQHVRKPRQLVLDWADTPKRQARVFQLFQHCYALWQVYYDGVYSLTVARRERVSVG
jgi:pyrroloquinoline quinone (PQQ) biosynthesis protein C